MNKLLSSLSSIYWWISVVVVGVSINIASVYITRKFDARLSRTSSWWKERSKKKKAEYLKDVAVLRASRHEQIMASFTKVGFQMLSINFMVLGLACMGFALGLEFSAMTTKNARVAIIVSASLMLVGAMSLFMCIQYVRKVMWMIRLIGDSRHALPQDASRKL